MKLPCEYLDISNAKDAVVKQNGSRFEWHSTESGLFCLSRAKHVKFYSALVWKNGGYLSLYDGDGRIIFSMPTVFTGSFLLDGGCSGGLYARVGAANCVCPANTVTFMTQEQDA